MIEVSKLKNISKSIEDWSSITNESKLQTIRSLKSMAKIDTCQIPKDSEMSCPEHGHAMSSPCSLSQCAYYISNPKSFNCIYHSLDSSKKKKLTPNEISTCLGITVNQINQHLSSAVQKIRLVKVEDDITAEKLNKFSYLEGSCVNCGINIEDELDLGLNPSLIIEHGKHGYCSDDCRKQKLPWKFKLENKYGTDWEYVIIKTLSYIKTIKATSKEIEGLLGVDPNSLNEKDKTAIAVYKRIYSIY